MSHAPLSASARTAALRFVVAGKSPAQLEAWLKQHAPVDWARLKGSTDRFPLMRAAEDRLEQIRREEQEAGAGGGADDEEEDEADAPRRSRSARASTTGAAAAGGAKKKAASTAAAAAAAASTTATTKRKSRTSIGYETGTKPDAASPRGKPAAAAAGSKRKAHAADDSADDGSDAASAHTDEASSAASSPRDRPAAKKSRTGSKGAAAAAGAAGRKSSAGAAAGKKGRATRHVSEDDDEDSRSRGSSVSRDEEVTMRDAPKAPAKAPTLPSQPASRRASTAAAPAAAPVQSAPFVDASLFGPTPAASAASSRRPSFHVHDAALEDAEEEEEEDRDQPMRSPSPSPSAAEGKFEAVSAPAPVKPNPFQSASPTTSPQPAATKQPSAVHAAAARLSSGGAKGTLPDYEPRFVSAASLVPTPFTQARSSLSPRPPAASPFAAAASAPQPQAQPQPTGLRSEAKFNPLITAPPASASFAFSPATSAVAGFQLSPPQQAQRRDDDFGLGSLPSYQPPVSQRRATMPPVSPFAFSQQQQQQQEVPPQQQRRYSDQYQQSPYERQQQMESKYSQQQQLQQQEQDYGGYQQLPDDSSMDAEGLRQRRRYSDHVAAEGFESETAGGGVSPSATKEKPASLVARARLFLSSLFRFLLRTLLIGLMVATVGMVLVDGRLWKLLTGPPPSLTVFCPSNPHEPRPTEFPPGSGQMICKECPPHGFCTEGKLTCVDSRLYVREGDECVLNDQAHRDAIKYKQMAIDLLEKHVGRVMCGESDVRPGTARSLSEPDLKAQMQHELQRDFDLDLWAEAFHLLEKESAPIADRDLTSARVLARATRLGMEYEAASPQFSLACSIWMMVTNWLGHIIAASMIISIITYLWFQFRRNQWRRSQVPLVIDEVCARLMHSREHGVMVGGEVPAKPLAIPHLRDEYLSGHMSAAGKRGDAGVWDMVVKRLAKDTRIEKSKALFGNTQRDAWTWTAPAPRDFAM